MARNFVVGSGRPYVKSSDVVVGVSNLSGYSSGQWVTVYNRKMRLVNRPDGFYLVPRIKKAPMSMAAFRLACQKPAKDVLPVVQG